MCIVVFRLYVDNPEVLSLPMGYSFHDRYQDLMVQRKNKTKGKYICLI